jgi:hypothetical protein
MIKMSTPDQLQRGIRTLARGELTGARAAGANEAAKERQAIIANSVRMMQDPDTQLTIVHVPGGSPFALPKHVVAAIQRAAR